MLKKTKKEWLKLPTQLIEKGHLAWEQWASTHIYRKMKYLLKEYFLQRAEELGFEVDDLIFVDQGLNQNAVGSDSAAPLKNDLG